MCDIIKRRTLVIADDDEMSLEILTQVFQEDYKIITVKNGNDALEVIIKYNEDICCILLDMNMPVFSGYQILQYIKQTHIISQVPIILITAENDKQIELNCYSLGAQAYITKPFESKSVRQQVKNIVSTYEELNLKIQELESQKRQLSRYNNRMLEVVANLIEDRSEESGLHVKRVKEITKILSRAYKTLNSCSWTQDYIDNIAQASMLHDIGKIYIPDNILNKPGKLTPEERTIMEGHAQKGRDIIEKHLSSLQNKTQLTLTMDICYCHHERYDGKGYPRGLVGDAIPITAQIVSIADAYDALVSDRCYRKAFSFDVAYNMIKDGKCGVFNPLLIKCLTQSLPEIEHYSISCKTLY